MTSFESTSSPLHTPALSDEEYLDLFRKIKAHEISPAEAFDVVAGHDFVTVGIVVSYLLQQRQDADIFMATIGTVAIRNWAKDNETLIKTRPRTPENEAVIRHLTRLETLL